MAMEGAFRAWRQFGSGSPKLHVDFQLPLDNAMGYGTSFASRCTKLIYKLPRGAHAATWWFEVHLPHKRVDPRS